MRESFGAYIMLRIFIVIFVVFVGFICVAAVFGKAFRVKNSIISAIEEAEECNIIHDDTGHDTCSNIDFKDYFSSMGYTLGYDVSVENSSVEDSEYAYYIVTTYTNWDLPGFDLLQGTWKATGKTRLIHVGRTIGENDDE